MKNIYLSLAVLGAIIPYFFFVDFISKEGINISLFIHSLFINAPASGFSADLLISSLVFWLYMFSKNKTTAAPKPYWFILINLTIGLSCALPAYLYQREKLHQANLAITK